MRVIYQSKIIQVPQQEMPTVYSLDKANKDSLKKGMWVRVKSGEYHGDLAKVAFAEEGKPGVYLKLIPRIAGVSTADEQEEKEAGRRGRKKVT